MLNVTETTELAEKNIFNVINIQSHVMIVVNSFVNDRLNSLRLRDAYTRK